MQAVTIFPQTARLVRLAFPVLILFPGLILTGLAHCFAGAQFKVGRLVAHPPAVALHENALEHGLIVLAGDNGSRLTDVTRLARYSSSRPEVIAVSTNGALRALAHGAAEIIVGFGGKSVKIPVTARDTESRRAMSFRQDIEPVLTRAGCNMGACHGKLAGQNGFKLSLRGYAPELDYTAAGTHYLSVMDANDKAGPAHAYLLHFIAAD